MPAEIRKVTSKANAEIKKIRSLEMRKYREEEGLFITEGLRHALEAAEAGWNIQTLVIEESVRNKDLVKKLIGFCPDTLILETSRDIMEGLTHRDNPQTVIAVLKQRWNGLPDAKAEAGALWVALEEIRDPGNLGTIMRTADAVGAAGVILIENTCDPYSMEAIRASMGSFAHVKLVRCRRNEFIGHVGREKFQVVGTHLKTDHDYRKIEYKTPSILLMGTEQAGLSEDIARACTHLVKIPMCGKADSLNVSVATAIMLYEMNRAQLKI